MLTEKPTPPLPPIDSPSSELWNAALCKVSQEGPGASGEPMQIGSRWNNYL